MPAPTLLPALDWQTIFSSGKPFADWLAAATGPEKRARIEEGLRAQTLVAPIANLLKTISRPVHVVAIAEDWCGDVVRHVPVLECLAQALPKLQTRYITREQHKDVFVRYLTNGGESIPKFIFLSDAFVECGNWGPMTEVCRRAIARGKACGDLASARKKVSQLYAMDADKSEVVTELGVLLNIAAADAP